jgi:hypothetical protein
VNMLYQQAVSGTRRVRRNNEKAFTINFIG